MNNNICKWGAEHQKNLLEKGKNLSRRLVKKILLSLSLLGMLFVGGNAYGAVLFPILDWPNKNEYGVVEIVDGNEANPVITKNYIEDCYFDSSLPYQKQFFWFKSDYENLIIKNSFFHQYSDVIVAEDFFNLSKYQSVFIENIGCQSAYLTAQQFLEVNGLTIFDGYESYFLAKEVVLNGLYIRTIPDFGEPNMEYSLNFGGLDGFFGGYASQYVTLNNIYVGSHIAKLKLVGANLRNAVTFTNSVNTVEFINSVIYNNAIDNSSDVSTVIFNNSIWNPTSGAGLNNVDSIEFSGGNLYTDNLIGYKNDLLLFLPNLLHEGTNKFAEHILPQHTKISAFYLDYTLEDKAYYMAMHEDILRFQNGSEEVLVKIENGGDGKFITDPGYDYVYNYYGGYYYLGGQRYNYDQAYDNINRTYKTPDNIATIYYDVSLNAIEGEKELTATYKLNRIDIKGDNYFSLNGNIGSESEYIDLDGGFTGKGGLNLVAETDENGDIVDTAIYLGGDANTYTGATIVNSGVTLHLENADSISASEELKLYGNASFVVDNSTGTGNEFTNFNKVTLVGTSSTGADGATQTQINGGSSTIKLDGTGKQFSFFQEDSLHPDEPSAAANFAPANSPVTYSGLLTHHTVNVTDLDVEILNGASLLVNYLGKTIGGNLDPSAQDNMTDLAILALDANSNVLIDGYGAGDNTSAHLYMGNGIIRLDSGSSLTLAGGAAIHLSAHRDGMFEYPYNDDGTPITDLADEHKHASIELNGGTLNLELDAQSHLYSDHILSADHKHYLIGAAQVNSDGTPISPVTVANNVTFSLTQAAIDRIDGLIDDTIPQDWEDQYHIPLEQAQQLQTIYKNEDNKYTKLLDAIKNTSQPSTITELKNLYVDAVGNSDDFNDLMSSLVTLGMNNDVHGFMFQKYGVQFTDEGAYMYVLETLSVEDFINQTGIQVSIKNEVNETLDILQGGKQQDYVNSGAFEIINNVLDTVTGKQTYDETVAAARTVDSAAQLATVAGTQTLAWDMLQTRSDSTQRHLDSIKNLPSNKLHLWADFLYMHNSSHSMWTDVNGEREVQADLGGFIAGGDYRYNENAVAGASFSFMAGTAETTLGKTYSLDISNDVYSLAGSVYAQYDFAPGWRVRGDVAYQYTNNDAEMFFPAVYNISDKLTADVGTNAVQALAAVEKDVNLSDTVVLTPYLGVKYTYLRTDGYTSKLGVKDAFTTDAADQHIVSVPVGVKVSKEIELKNGKKVTPRAGVYVQPNFGDTEVENHVQGAGLKSSDTIHPDVIGTFSFGAHVGAEMELNDKFSLALDYNYNGSDKSNNHNVTASIVFKF